MRAVCVPPGLAMVTNVSKAGRVVPSANVQPVASDGEPDIECPSDTGWANPGNGRSKYIGRSATTPRAASVWTWTETPCDTGSETPVPMPPGSLALKTWTVRRLPAGTSTVRTTEPLPSRKYSRVTGTGAAVLGLASVMNSRKSGRTLPSAKYTSRLAPVPKPTVPPLTGRSATVASMYTGRSTRMGSVDDTAV